MGKYSQFNSNKFKKPDTVFFNKDKDSKEQEATQGQVEETQQDQQSSTEAQINTEQTTAENTLQSTTAEPQQAKEVTAETVKENTQSQKSSPQIQEKQPAKSTSKKEEFVKVKAVEFDIYAYMDGMLANVPANAQVAGKWQYSMYKNILNILSKEDPQQAHKELATLIHVFRENKDKFFNEKHAFYPEGWPGSDQEFVTFRRLMYCFFRLANADKKTVQQEIKLDLLIQGLNEIQANNLVSFIES